MTKTQLASATHAQIEQLLCTNTVMVQLVRLKTMTPTVTNCLRQRLTAQNGHGHTKNIGATDNQENAVLQRTDVGSDAHRN
jgi:hypothetical protein